MSTNVYDIINSRITALLEQQLIPWRKPWNAQVNYPKNFVSNKPYKGINVWLTASQSYSSPYWLSFKQATELGGHVKRGEKSTPIVFYKLLDKSNLDQAINATGKIPLLRFYSIFNTDQCEGLPEIPAIPEVVNPFTPIERAEQIISGMPLRPEIKHGGNRAYYSPKLDYIQLPPQSAFASSEEYYCCKFHEAVHASGHENRLGRKSILEPSYFGSHEYSKEELVAEMGAAFLCGYSGIEQKTLDNSAAYIQGWLKALKNDKTLLVQAAAAAQKAADYILNAQPDDMEAEHDLLL